MKIEVRKPTEEELEQAKTWPVWEKEASNFPWEYSEQETFYVVEGEVTVHPAAGDPVSFSKGDLVVMPKGLKCTWNITKGVRKHYKFG